MTQITSVALDVRHDGGWKDGVVQTFVDSAPHRFTVEVPTDTWKLMGEPETLALRVSVKEN